MRQRKDRVDFLMETLRDIEVSAMGLHQNARYAKEQCEVDVDAELTEACSLLNRAADKLRAEIKNRVAPSIDRPTAHSFATSKDVVTKEAALSELERLADEWRDTKYVGHAPACAKIYLEALRKCADKLLARIKELRNGIPRE